VAYGAEAIRPAPGPLQDAFTRTPAAEYRTCLLLEGFVQVRCARSHDAEYTGVAIEFGPDPVYPFDDPPRLNSALNTCQVAFADYVPQPPPVGIDYSVTSPPVADYHPSVGVEIRCAAYYSDGSLTSKSVRD